MKRSLWTTSFLTVAVAACFLCCDAARAKKPDNPGGGNDGGGQNGGGVIYFCYRGELYTMNDDGSDVTAVAGYPEGFNASFEPSRQLHDGKRWFPYLNGEELLGLSDAGGVVSLHSDPQLDVWSDIRWQVGDEAISWTGRRRDDTGAVVEGGIYTTPVNFDAAGNIASAGPTELLVSLPLIDNGSGSLAPNILKYDWSPDGTRLVYDTLSSEIVIADLLTGTFDTVVSDMRSPRWSPAGDKLMVRYRARKGRDAVGVMNLDGSNLKLVESDGVSWWTEVGGWSPSGSHLAYLHQDRMGDDSYIARATANGTRKRRLTDGTVAWGIGGPRPLGWRTSH